MHVCAPARILVRSLIPNETLAVIHSLFSGERAEKFKSHNLILQYQFCFML